MEWDEVDLPNKIWIVPAIRMKAKREHRVPLSDAAVLILNRMKQEYGGLLTSRGLARMDAPSGTILAYSTSPSMIATNGNRGDRNSPYTKSLLRAIQQQNTPIEQVFEDVRRMVVEQTKGEQVPWENSSLIGNFVFKR